MSFCFGALAERHVTLEVAVGMVRVVGIEPTLLAEHDFEPSGLRYPLCIRRPAFALYHADLTYGFRQKAHPQATDHTPSLEFRAHL